jgi:Leucine-rich repeat (LRR) protein
MKGKLLLIFIFSLLFLKPNKSAAQATNVQDSLALVDLYNSTNGSAWVDNTNWLTKAPLNSWYGVTMSDGRVTQLHLINNRLVGSLPATIGNLTSLNILNFRQNQLNGVIPSSVGSFKKLWVFDVSSNKLFGEIPSSLLALRTASDPTLDISRNNFTFTGAEEIFNYFPATYNPQYDIPIIKNGSLLSVAAGGKVANNTYKWYKDTTLVATKTGDSTFFATTSGNYSVVITNSKAQYLTLYSISAASAQDSLALVDLYNQTTGAGWINSYNWVSTAPVATWYGVTVRFGRVTELGLTSNNLAGTIPSSIGNLTAVKGLNFSSNKITGEIPAVLSTLANLEGLALNDNLLWGSIPSSFGSLTSLKVLSLNNNQLTGSIPSEITGMSSLNTIDFSNNKLVGNIPSTIEKLKNLGYFNANKNQLTGIIPETIGNLSKLGIFYATGNRLEGQIPASFGRLSNLSQLYLDDNLLTGTIPDSIANIAPLARLVLSKNQLTGKIPDSLGIATWLGTHQLFDLELDNNHLSGPIPSSLNKNTFATFKINNNQFTFDGMENIPQSHEGYTYSPEYSPQDSIPLSKNGNLLSVMAGGTLANDTFRLYKDNVLLATHVGDSTFTLPGEGRFYIDVTNTIATVLTLHSKTITVSLPLANANITTTENIKDTYATDVNNGEVKLVTLTPTQGANSLTGNVTAAVTIDTAVSEYHGRPYVQRHYDVTPAVNAQNAQATVTLYFTQKDFDNYNDYVVAHHLTVPLMPTNGTDNGNVRIFQYHGTFTASPVPSNYSDTVPILITPAVEWDSSKNWWAVTFPVSGFSGFFLSTGNFTLPLTLLDFTASDGKNRVDLSWNTTNEINTKQFTIERSNDNRSFKSIGQVSAQSGPGNHSYIFTDVSPLSPKAFYRLAMIDKDGATTYSKIVVIDKKSGASTLTIYPNPARDLTILTFHSFTNSFYEIEVSDLSGKIVRRISGKASIGENSISIDCNAFAKGAYNVTLIVSEGRYSSKFIRQ